MNIEKEYEIVKKAYAAMGVDTDKAIEALKKITISINCWQGDDVRGFLLGKELSGGIQTTGNYKGRARTPEELKEDIKEALSLLPGKYNLNLHSTYLDTTEEIELDQIEPKHYKSWVKFAKENHIGLDFNPTMFAHPKAESGFTLSSSDDEIRQFWIEHCKRSRKIGEYFGKELGIPCVTNLWTPDGYKDIPYDRLAPRLRFKESLDEIYSEKIDHKYNIDAIESKLFGIGVEAYTVGSNEFCYGYAITNKMAICLDSGHFHPTEVISDKISAVSLFVDHILLHVSRPVRWDSDHVVILDDELYEIGRSLIRNNLIDKTSIGLDFFDASINRIAAWVVGVRSTLISLLKALLEPTELLKKIEKDGNYTDRMFITERLKTMDYGKVFDYYCHLENKKVGLDALEEIHVYENRVLNKRGN